jgi:hypothetical protein
LPSLAKGWVTLRPHDSTKIVRPGSINFLREWNEFAPCAVLNQRVVELLKSTFT